MNFRPHNWLALALGLLQGERPAPHGPEPGPRTVLAGLAGFQTVSCQDFGTRRNRLTAAYHFPDRVRWIFEGYEASPATQGPSEAYYRYGASVSHLSGRVTPLAEAQSTTVMLQMELRRAAMLWPDGVEWSEAGAERIAEIYADSCCHEGRIGTLVARLREASLASIEARDSANGVVESIHVLAWQDFENRKWPARIQLESHGARIEETIESLSTQVFFVESAFKPPDQRARPAATQSLQVVQKELPSITLLRSELSAGMKLEAAIQEARLRIAQAQAAPDPLGKSVDPVPCLQLSASGAPTHVWVRLTKPLQPAPKGWETLPKRPGILFGLPDTDSVSEVLSQGVQGQLPPGKRGGTPYLRVHDRAAMPIELVVPILSEE